MLRTREPKPSRGRRFLVTFLLFLAGLILWSLAIPMFGAADENHHMLASWAIVHGQGRGSPDATGTPTYLAPPEFFRINPCWALRPNQPAVCSQADVYSGPDIHVDSTTGSYPPYYYALVGWPTLIASGRWSLYLMRFVSAAYVALMMALAVDTLARVTSPGPLLLGLAVALVPVAYFFGASVNPSGLAIAATLAAWTGGILLARGDPLDLGPASVARLAGPVCVLLLLRRDSLYWALLVMVALLALTPWSRVRHLARSRAVWIGLAAVGVCAVVSYASGGGAASDVAGVGHPGSFWGAVQSLPYYVQQLVGILGWVEVYLPFAAYVLVEAMVAFLVIAACFFASHDLAAVTAGIAVAVFLLPLALGTIRIGYFQGRYEVGFAAGLPLVAALAIGEQMEARGLTWPKRAQVVGLAVMAFVQIDSFMQMMRRFSAGASGQWWIFSSPQWTPPYLTLTGLAVLFAVATVALYAWLFWQSQPVALARPLIPGRLRPSDQYQDMAEERRPTPPIETRQPDDAAVLAELEDWGLTQSEGVERPPGGPSSE